MSAQKYSKYREWPANDKELLLTDSSMSSMFAFIDLFFTLQWFETNFWLNVNRVY